jgi:hypothetical protein
VLRKYHVLKYLQVRWEKFYIRSSTVVVGRYQNEGFFFVTKIPDRAEMVVRVPRDLKAWMERQAALDGSSQNSVLIRALRLFKAEAERQAA